MSRVGKHSISLPAGVTVNIAPAHVEISGRLGKISCQYPEVIKITQDGTGVAVTPVNNEAFSRSMWGTMQRNIKNAVKGVSEGFTYNLDLVGVGYRASVQGRNIVLQLGFSHDITYPLPQGVEAKCEKPTAISLTGADKQVLGQIASELQSYRPPEPYKGKGVIKEKQFVLRKEGKKK